MMGNPPPFDAWAIDFENVFSDGQSAVVPHQQKLESSIRHPGIPHENFEYLSGGVLVIIRQIQKRNDHGDSPEIDEEQQNSQYQHNDAQCQFEMLIVLFVFVSVYRKNLYVGRSEGEH